jgi:hypothetical protein
MLCALQYCYIKNFSLLSDFAFAKYSFYFECGAGRGGEGGGGRGRWGVVSGDRKRPGG